MRKIKITKNGNYDEFEISKTGDKVLVKGLKVVRVGQYVTFTVTITTGKPGIRKDGGYSIGVPCGFTEAQFGKPEREGFTTFTTGSKAKISLEKYFDKERYIKLLVTEGELKPGEKITVCFGDRSKGGPGTEVRYQAFRDALLGVFRLSAAPVLAAASPRVSILHQSFNNLRCHLTPVYKDGEKVRLVIIAEDAYGNRCEDFTGDIYFTNRTIGKTLPEKLKLDRKDRGRKEFWFVTSGLDSFRVGVRYKDTDMLSNPCIKLKEDFKYKLFFGELHAHTEHSHDGAGSLDELYKFARDTAVLDFSAASDHQTQIKGLQGYGAHTTSYPFYKMGDMEKRWRLTCDKAKEYNVPGGFVTFPGFEFAPSGLQGHRNLYFKEDYPKMIDGSGWNKTSDLINPFVKSRDGVLVIPHHPPIRFGNDPKIAGKGLIYEEMEQKYQPVVEIYSKHGNSEYLNAPRPLKGQLPGYFIQDMLARGNKFGFIAGSDTHSANPGSSMVQAGPFTTLQYRSGLACVWAKELTREALFEAIFARRTYATTYNRTVIFFYVNHLFMGEEGAVKGPRNISLKAFSGTKIHKMEIIKNNEIIFAAGGHLLLTEMEINYEDKAASGKNEDYYYARITEAGGEISWSSPVWVKNI